MFPLNRDAVSRLMPPERLRWIAFGHFEADECGAMNEWLAIAPQAQAAHGQTGCMVSLNDFADRPPRILSDGETIDLGGGSASGSSTRRIRRTVGMRACSTRRQPRTLLCGDLFTQLGDGSALTDGDIVGPAIAAEDLFKYSSLSPGMGTTIRGLAKLSPRTLALMHGPSFSGDGGAALRALADDYDRRTSNRELAVDKIEAA